MLFSRLNKTVKAKMGRKKITIKPIDNAKSRRVTFNKRRIGLMKKAMELSILCGVQVMVLVRDDNDDMYTYSSADFDDMVRQYRSFAGEYEHLRSEDLMKLEPGKASSFKIRRIKRKKATTSRSARSARSAPSKQSKSRTSTATNYAAAGVGSTVWNNDNNDDDDNNNNNADAPPNKRRKLLDTAAATTAAAAAVASSSTVHDDDNGDDDNGNDDDDDDDEEEKQPLSAAASSHVQMDGLLAALSHNNRQGRRTLIEKRTRGARNLTVALPNKQQTPATLNNQLSSSSAATSAAAAAAAPPPLPPPPPPVATTTAPVAPDLPATNNKYTSLASPSLFFRKDELPTPTGDVSMTTATKPTGTEPVVVSGNNQFFLSLNSGNTNHKGVRGSSAKLTMPLYSGVMSPLTPSLYRLASMQNSPLFGSYPNNHNPFATGSNHMGSGQTPAPLSSLLSPPTQPQPPAVVPSSPSGPQEK